MSLDDDLATVNAVTDKLVGPLKVWMLQIWPQDRADRVRTHLHYTFEGVCATVRDDIEANAIDAEIDYLIEHFKPTGHMEFGGTIYHAWQQEIKE